MEFKDTSLETKSSLRYGEPMIAEKKYKKTAYDYLKSEFKGDYDVWKEHVKELRSKSKILKIKVGGRGTYYCPKCQK